MMIMKTDIQTEITAVLFLMRVQIYWSVEILYPSSHEEQTFFEQLEPNETVSHWLHRSPFIKIHLDKKDSG